MCRRFAQVAHATAAAQVWRLLLFVGEWHTVAEAAVEMIGGEVEVAHLFFVAVAVGVSAFFGEAVAVAQIAVAVFMGEVKCFDFGLFEGEQLAFLADAVLIQVAPDAQLGKSAVGGIYLAVTVVIKIGQGLIAVGGTLAVFERGVVAEQLAAIIDDAVAIAVINEETVVLVYPASGGADAILVVVKERAFMTVAGKGFDTVAVKVEGEGVVLHDERVTKEVVPILMNKVFYYFGYVFFIFFLELIVILIYRVGKLIKSWVIFYGKSRIINFNRPSKSFKIYPCRLSIKSSKFIGCITS